MTERPIGVSDVATGAGVAEYRTRERVVAAATVDEQYLILAEERVPSFRGMATTFRVPPDVSSSTRNVCSLFNKTGSGVLVALRRLSMQVDYTSNTTTIRYHRIQRVTAAPFGGTVHTPTPFDTADTHNANVEFMGSASADGVLSAINATLTQPNAWKQFHWRTLTSTAGQALIHDDDMVPRLAAGDPVILRESQGVVLTADFAAETHGIANCVWEEFTLP